MSNIYIQEPPTSGKVLLQTTVGDIDIELWSREAPKACRNFVQLCLEKYYDGTVFHRVVKGFIAQGGDPKGDGTGGESIYGAPFKDEFHSRLRFVRRGLVALANSGKDDNGSQFFFTLAACPELQNKHTIFGKIVGDTLYNMLKLEDCLVDENERPHYPHKIISSKVLLNPFMDILVRNKEVHMKTEICKPQEKIKKNFKLLSFGEEAEEEEYEVDCIAEKFRGKSKSSHDLTNDPKLSSVSALPLYTKSTEDDSKPIEIVKKKLKLEQIVEKDTRNKVPIESGQCDGSAKSSDDRESVKDEIKELIKHLRQRKCSSSKEESQMLELDDTRESLQNSSQHSASKNPMLVDFHKQYDVYAKKQSLISSDKTLREKQTLDMLANFKKKLQNASCNISGNDDAISNETTATNSEITSKNEWLTHKLQFEDSIVIAKDANVPTEDRYDITDPRNPLTQARRKESRKRRHH